MPRDPRDLPTRKDDDDAVRPAHDHAATCPAPASPGDDVALIVDSVSIELPVPTLRNVVTRALAEKVKAWLYVPVPSPFIIKRLRPFV